VRQILDALLGAVCTVDIDTSVCVSDGSGNGDGVFGHGSSGVAF
jgi:hypothetical protein